MSSINVNHINHDLKELGWSYQKTTKYRGMAWAFERHIDLPPYSATSKLCEFEQLL